MRYLIDIVEKAECRTPGAVYNTHIDDHEISVTVELPPEVEVPDMNAEQGQRFDDLIHDAMEDVVATMMAELDDEADLHWEEARRNDKTPD